MNSPNFEEERQDVARAYAEGERQRAERLRAVTSPDTVAAPICTDSEADYAEALAWAEAQPDDIGTAEYRSGLAALLRTLRAQPSATLGGVTVTADMVREAIDAAHLAIINNGSALSVSVLAAAHLTAALSLQNATPDATRARETGE